MAPRTRRAAAQKQSQYRIPDEDEDEDIHPSTPVGKRNVGGVLASLSHNVPAVKSRKSAKKISAELSKAGTLESKDETYLQTPPPPTSVFVGQDHDYYSPLTQPRLPKQRPIPNVDDKSIDDGSTAISCESMSPTPKNCLIQKPRKVIEDESSSHNDDEEISINVDEEEGDTAEMDEDEEEDPNETILESETSEGSDDEVESEDEESDEDLESDTQDDEYVSDDDEYVPEEEEESGLDEDLDSYVEPEKEKKRSLSRNRKEAEIRKEQLTQEHNSKSNQAEDATLLAGNPDIEENETNSVCSFESSNTDYDTNECVAVATTPERTKPPALVLEASPEPEMAVILDDDDDSEDDVLVATILDDYDDDSAKKQNSDNDIREEVGVDDFCNDDSASTDDEADEYQDGSDDMNESDEEGVSPGQGDAPFQQDGHESPHESPRLDSEPFAHAENNGTKGSSGALVLSNNILEVSAKIENHLTACGEAATEHAVNKTLRSSPKQSTSIVDTSNRVTPQKQTKKSRKSFFRVDGIVKRGKWKLGSKIGVGSFGVVHVGMNNETGKLMAVKKFKVDEAVMKDIRREVDLMKSLNHPNIVRYLGAQMDKTHLHIFQEWVPGGSVATLLGRFGPFSLPVIRSYLSQTLEGLAYLHENDIMHRDIKGSNILVNDEGVVKLADFGASKKLRNLRANLMMSLTVRGTPYFMSPEVFEEKYSAKADIWGIGCVAYQMITGSPPWKDKGFSNPISLFNYIKKHAGPPIVDAEHKERLLSEDKSIYHWLNDLLECCFSKDPMSRPDATELLEHKFFTEMHDDVDDDSIYSRGLFSPASVMKSTAKYENSPDEDTQLVESPSPSPLRSPCPTPTSQARSKSVIQWRTTFSSPPRPKNSGRHATKSKMEPIPARSSPYRSPRPDTSNWPDWARTELQKRNLFDKHPSKEVSSPVTEDSNLSAMMGSLALSEDSGIVSYNPYQRVAHGRVSTIGTASEESKLVGLSILNDSNVTYEI